MWRIALHQLGFLASHYGIRAGHICFVFLKRRADALGHVVWNVALVCSQLFGGLHWRHRVGSRLVRYQRSDHLSNAHGKTGISTA